MSSYLERQHLTFSYGCCMENGLVVALHEGFTDSPKAETVREAIDMARKPTRHMYQEIVAMLAGRIAERMQPLDPSSAEYLVCEQQLKEMFSLA